MTALKAAIRTTLTGDATYLSLMGDPYEEPYQTFYIRPPERPVFPQMVFTLRPVSYDQSFGKDLKVGTGELTIIAWAKDNAYEGITDRVIFLLHHASNSQGFRAILARDSQELYDDDFNAYGLVTVFDLHYRRAVI